MSIPAKQVMDLRAATGMPMMKCKKALEAEDGDFEKAVDRLRKEGLKAAEIRADRVTGEGLVCAHLSEDRRRGTMVAVACETDPVARTPMFVEFVDRLVEHVDEKAPADTAVLLAQAWIDDPEQTVDVRLRGLIGKIRENMRIQEFARLDLEGRGLVGAYVHYTNKDGALVALSSENEDADLEDLAKRLCMHIVFSKPTVLSRDEIPEDVRARETEIARAQVEQDPKMAKKPPEVLERIVEGKLGAFYKQAVLPEQDWVVDPGSKCTVADILRQHGATIQAFCRLQVGG